MALPAGRYGVTKNQLLKIKKLPMNTIKLIEDLYEKYSLLGSAAFKNSTSVVTESTDLVESGAVAQSLVYTVDYPITHLSALNWISPEGSQLSYAGVATRNVLPTNAKLIGAIPCEPWGSSIGVMPNIAIDKNNQDINLVIKQSDTPGTGDLTVRLAYTLI